MCMLCCHCVYYHMVLIVLKGNCLDLDKNVKTDPLRVAVMQAATLFSLVSVATKTELLIILQNILSVETVMNGLWPVGVEEVGKHYGTNEAIYEINWNWSELDISMWGKDVYWQKCKLVGLEHLITFGIGVFTTFFLKHISSPWPSSSLCASNGGRRMARNPVEKEHFNISILKGFCQTIPDDIMSVWMQITLTLSDSLLCSQGQESTSKLSYKSLSNFTAVVN